MINNMSCPPMAVDKCDDGTLVLPILNEATWNQGFRTFLYLIALLWCFMGVAIIADVFMCAIETITSKTKVVMVAKQGRSSNDMEEVHVRVWNDTVANLTLMALGSSAPEILLAIIEITANKFESGALGPSTIVGSAAFNLLVISGVCVMAVPAHEVRRIKAIKVFGVTATFCILAYIWLYVALSVSSPEIMDIWEAVLTFLLFPILVIIAYIADKEYCCATERVSPEDTGALELGEYTFDADPFPIWILCMDFFVRMLFELFSKFAANSQRWVAKLQRLLAFTKQSVSYLENIIAILDHPLQNWC